MFVAFEVKEDGEERVLTMKQFSFSVPLLFSDYDDYRKQFMRDFCNENNIKKVRIVKFTNGEIIEEITPDSKE